MVRRNPFAFALFLCLCAALAFALPVTSVRSRSARAAAAVPLTGGPDAFGYNWDRTMPFEWVDTSGGIQVPGGDDFCRGPYDIGFAFDFYGTT